MVFYLLSHGLIKWAQSFDIILNIIKRNVESSVHACFELSISANWFSAGEIQNWFKIHRDEKVGLKILME